MRSAIITQREGTDRYGAAIDSMEHAYIRFAERLGYHALPVSNGDASPESMLELPGEKLLILTGGGSLPASYYRADYGYGIQAERDRVEGRLLEAALEQDVPVLAICRGMQFCCGVYGGKVVRLEAVGRKRPAGEDHLICCDGRTVLVNSFHDDGILTEDLPDCFRILAVDEEKGNVEAFIMPGKRLLALQWHPERIFRDSSGEEFTRKLIQTVLQTGG